MALKAIIPSGLSEITVNGLHQWDYGQTLEIHSADLPTMVEVHFACAGMKEAVVHSCNAVEGVAEVPIPDRCLEQTAPIIAWVYAIGETSGVTIKTLTLTIIPRARPAIPVGEVPTAVSDKYTEAVAAMNDAVEKVEDGRVIAAHAINSTYALSADTSTTAYKDLQNHELSKAYYLSPVTGEDPRYLKGGSVDIDALRNPSTDCGVYTIDWQTIENYEVTTLPDDVPATKGAARLIVEADYNIGGSKGTVFQTLKMRVQLGEANTRIHIWTRQFDSENWSEWQRVASAKEIERKLDLGEGTLCNTTDATNGYSRVLTGAGYGYLTEAGLVSFLIRYKGGSYGANVMVDLLSDNTFYSNAFVMSRNDNTSERLMRLKFERSTSDGADVIRITLQWLSPKTDEAGALDGYPYEATDLTLGAQLDLFVKYLAKY